MKNRPKKPLISIFTTSVKRWNLGITQCELQRHQMLGRRRCGIVQGYVARSACGWVTIADAVGSCCQSEFNTLRSTQPTQFLEQWSSMVVHTVILCRQLYLSAWRAFIYDGTLSSFLYYSET